LWVCCPNAAVAVTISNVAIIHFFMVRELYAKIASIAYLVASFKRGSMMVKLSRIAPELPVSSLKESVEYYEQKLGFRVAMKMPSGNYAILERDDIAIHLF
jgi:hypothetical protein